MFKRRKHKIGLIWSIVFAILSSLSLILSPYMIGRAVDSMLGVGTVDMQKASYFLTLSLGLYLLHFMTHWVMSWVANRLSVSIGGQLREQVHDKIMRLPFAYLDTHAQGDVQQRFALDGELLMDGLYQAITQVFVGVFTVIFAGVYMFTLNIAMSMVVMAMVPIVFLTSRWITKRSMTTFRTQQDLAGDMSGVIAERFENSTLIITHNYQKASIESFIEMNDALNTIGEKAQFMSALTNPTTRVLNNMSYLLIGLIGAIVVQRWGMSIGSFTAFVSVSMIFSKPFNEFSAVISQVMAGKAGYERILKLLRMDSEADVENGQPLVGETVAFDAVNFAYNPSEPILKDFTMTIEPLSKVAIVGPTGAGKSTLINLLMRFYDPQSGCVSIDGKNIAHTSRHAVRETMGIVLQDPWLFAGSIRENIKYGKPEASDEAMVAAAKQADIHDYVMSLDAGYDTVVVEGSKNISLGHRQMITIARALLVNAPIMILDEATSSLDIVTEKRIQDVFATIMKQRTSFFVAHRLATVVDADLILVMKAGRLVEQGTHQSLMAQKGFYYEMAISQF